MKRWRPRGGFGAAVLTLLLSAVTTLAVHTWTEPRRVQTAFRQAPPERRARVLLSLLVYDPLRHLDTLLPLAEADPSPRVRAAAAWVAGALDAPRARPTRDAWLSLIPDDQPDADPLDVGVRQRRALRQALEGSLDPEAARAAAERAADPVLPHTLRLAAWIQDGDPTYTPIARGLLDRPAMPRDVALLALLQKHRTASAVLLDWFGPLSPLSQAEQAALLADPALTRVLRVALPTLPQDPSPTDASSAVQSYLGNP